jgi:hypothetical protein
MGKEEIGCMLYLGSTDEQLAFLIRRELIAGQGIDDQGLGLRDKLSGGALS